MALQPAATKSFKLDSNQINDAWTKLGLAGGNKQEALNKLTGQFVFDTWKDPRTVQKDPVKIAARNSVYEARATDNTVTDPGISNAVNQAIDELQKEGLYMKADPSTGLIYTKDSDGNWTTSISKAKKGIKLTTAYYHPAWSVISNWNRVVSASKALTRFISNGSDLDKLVRNRQISAAKSAVKRAWLFRENPAYRSYVDEKMKEASTKFNNRQKARLDLLGIGGVQRMNVENG